MHRGGLLATRRRRLGAFLSLSMVAATLSLTPAGGTAGAGPADCGDPPAIFPVEDLEPGMRGTGLTVIQGRDPVSFDVEVLGVLPDGIAPGVDFILVQVSGPVIDKTGGIAFGFSGSPVLIEGKLVGSISYGFFAADQTIGGVTPAEPMVALFDYPGPPGASGPRAVARRVSPSVRLTSGLRAAAARAAGVPAAEFPTTARQLQIPLAVSGLNARAMAKLERLVRRSGLPLVPYVSGASHPGGGGGRGFRPGDAVAASLSLGDLTFAGVGTVTAVCGSMAVAFGHPFFFEGPTGLGMNAADVVTVVRDPSSLFGPFKIANVAELVGTVDQDRLAGIRGAQGPVPTLTPVTSDVANPDLGRSRQGRTDVIKQELFGFSELPFFAAFHLLLNQDVVFDRIGDGTVALSFAVEGLGPTGAPFRLDRTNMFFSKFDVSFESILELLLYLEVLDSNPFGDVTFTGVHTDSLITQGHRVATIRRVRSASSVDPRLRQRDVLPVVRGDTIRLRVVLDPEQSDRDVRVDLTVKVPRRARSGGTLTVRGGGQDECFFCVFFGDEVEDETPSAGSFEELLDRLANAERHNDLVADLRANGSRRRSTAPQDLVVQGRTSIEVVVVG